MKITYPVAGNCQLVVETQTGSTRVEFQDLGVLGRAVKLEGNDVEDEDQLELVCENNQMNKAWFDHLKAKAAQECQSTASPASEESPAVEAEDEKKASDEVVETPVEDKIALIAGCFIHVKGENAEEIQKLALIDISLSKEGMLFSSSQIDADGSAKLISENELVEMNYEASEGGCMFSIESGGDEGHRFEFQDMGKTADLIHLRDGAQESAIPLEMVCEENEANANWFLLVQEAHKSECGIANDVELQKDQPQVEDITKGVKDQPATVI